MGKSGTTRWTLKEEHILREYYPAEGSRIADRLPGRSAHGIYAKACQLGLTTMNHYYTWTEEEDDILRQYYPTEGPYVCHRLPNRSSRACSNRASDLKIEKNRPNKKSWSQEEEKILANLCRQFLTKATKALPKRSMKTIISHAAEISADLEIEGMQEGKGAVSS